MEAQIIQQAIEHNVLAAAREVEDQIDNQLHALENLDSDSLETLREKRLQQLKLLSRNKQKWLDRGHGQYNEVLNEKDFFAEMKGEERLICHFYRENWPCKVMDKHLKSLAAAHLETKFIKQARDWLQINAEKSPFLVERLKIWMLPTLALVKHEKTVDYVVGFNELGGKDDFGTEVLEERLLQAGLLLSTGIESQAKSVPKQSNVMQSKIRAPADSDEDSDFD